MRWPDSLKGEYARLSTFRDPYLERGRRASALTVPSLLPPAGQQSGRKLRVGYSNFGARCVNSLSSKLLLSAFPARQSFFRLLIEDRLMGQLGGEEARTGVEEALTKMEAIVQADIEASAVRAPMGVALRHLVVCGNILLFALPDGGVKLYPLHSYVAHRDGEGNLLAHISEDRLSLDSLPDSVRTAVRLKVAEKASGEKTVCVYTGVYRHNGGWRVWQEVEGIKVPESEGTYPLDASPWMALRWEPVDGESYGRGMVEDYLGYFTALEALTKALVKGTAVAAKVVFLRKPNSSVKAKALAQSETGDVIDGNAEDVSSLQSEKQSDFRTAREMIADLKEELAYAFALNQAIQRNAERVTAEEIRFMAQELDAILGGVFSILSVELQIPYLRLRMRALQKAGKLPQLPQKALRPVIVTGLDALGRGAELDALRASVKDIVDLGGADALKTYVDFRELMTRLLVARGVRTKGLVKDEAQVAAEQQQQNLQALVNQLGPNAITQMGQLAKQGMASSQPTQ